RRRPGRGAGLAPAPAELHVAGQVAGLRVPRRGRPRPQGRRDRAAARALHDADGPGAADHPEQAPAARDDLGRPAGRAAARHRPLAHPSTVIASPTTPCDRATMNPTIPPPGTESWVERYG